MEQAQKGKRPRDTSPPAVSKRPKIANDHAVAQPPIHCLRIYSWNVNGIHPFLQPTLASFYQAGPKSQSSAPITTSLRNFLQRHNWPQILCLQEVKIARKDDATRRAMERAVNLCRSGADHGPEYVVRFSLPRDKFNATGFGGKVYGVATIIRQDFFDTEVTDIREVDWDLEGRVLIVETRSKLAIIQSLHGQRHDECVSQSC